MNILKELKEDLIELFKNAGYDVKEVELKESDRKDLGDFQLNDCMKLASSYHKSPRDIAEDIKKELDKDNRFTNVNIAGPGFINISLSNDYIKESINRIIDNPENLIEKQEKKKIVIDYGGANVAKTLHVGHLRTANIGEALKRLAKALGHDVVGDAHLGDYGRPLGLVEKEIKERYPRLPYFDEKYQGNFSEVELPITNDDLVEIYPIASKKGKEDEAYLEDARIITNKIQHHERGYYDLWKKIVDISKADIKERYKELNVDFELWNGESDAMEYFDELKELAEEAGVLVDSNGAKVIEVAEDTDKIEIPPLLFIKSNNTVSYETTDVATLLQRKRELDPDEVLYVVDFRQALHFTQSFRSAYKIGFIDKNVNLEHIGIGTMNGEDGKPFKTRDGGVLPLKSLIDKAYEETLKRINNEKVSEEEAPIIAKKVAIAAVKYADLLPYRETDYIFDIKKFTDIEGKTGPYVLYSTIRMKSLLNNAKDIKYDKVLTIDESIKDIALLLLDLPNVLTRSLKARSLNEIADYLFNICSSFNTFYAKNKVLTEENEEKRASWLAITNLLHEISVMLLNILAIEIPEKM